MKTRKRLPWLVLPILALMIASLACGTGFSTQSTIYGLSGKVQANLKEGDGVYNNSIEINEDWSYVRFSATVSLSVSAGSCRATLSGGENTQLVLEASAGSPNNTSGELVTDGFGEVDLETNCQDAEEMTLTIDFTRK